MPTISAGQIATYIKNAGATDSVAVTMVAIALAESGGNTDAIGDVSLENSTWGPSVGLWQIRSLNSEKGTGGTRDEVANHNPQTNANHAMQILNGSGLSAWSTYTNQAYRAHLPAANTGVGSPQATDATLASSDSSNPFSSLGKVFTTLAAPGTWTRITVTVVGVIAMLFGIIVIVKQTSVGKAATGAVKKGVEAAGIVAAL